MALDQTESSRAYNKYPEPRWDPASVGQPARDPASVGQPARDPASVGQPAQDPASVGQPARNPPAWVPACSTPAARKIDVLKRLRHRCRACGVVHVYTRPPVGQHEINLTAGFATTEKGLLRTVVVCIAIDSSKQTLRVELPLWLYN